MKIIKEIKMFPSGSMCIETKKSLETPDDVEQFDKELNDWYKKNKGMYKNPIIMNSKEFRSLVKTDIKLFTHDLPASVEMVLKEYLKGNFIYRRKRNAK